MPKRQENLIPINERTKSEQRELQKKGGKASGKARRKKADLRKAMQAILDMNLPASGIKNQLEEMGLDPNMGNGLVLSVALTAISEGDHNALKTIVQIAGQNTTLADRQEQKARIEKLKAETKRAQEQAEGVTEVEDDGFIEALSGCMEETWDDHAE